MINLCKNAIAAAADQTDPKIELMAGTDGKGFPIMEIVDNGRGIQEEVIEKIFVPFFTTKKDGTGIGLALSKQIMRLHGGTISAASDPNERTTFTLRF